MLKTPLSYIWIVLLISCQPIDREEPRQSGAGKAMDLWTLTRAYPGKTISTAHLTRAFQECKSKQYVRSDQFDDWQNIGPANIAGRILTLGFDPFSPDIIYAGSASGGLWKTITAGVGEDAWEYVPTGFPILAVSAIAVHPENPDIIYIGTGEVYNPEAAKPGEVERFTRGTYGIGILKSVDGGRSWEKVLDWEQTDLKGVQEILIHPVDHDIIFAATTEGLFRSKNRGLNWELIHNTPMATDVDIHPDRPDRIFVCCGSLNNYTHGIYRSEDGGNTFQLLSNGLSSFSGKARLAIHPLNPDLIVASLANVVSTVGLFKSVDGGSRWLMVNSTNVAEYQGWYSHDVEFHPSDPDILIWAGIDIWRSVNGGQSFTRISQSDEWDFGQVPAGGPEGSFRYVHADIHRTFYHPLEENEIYVATDGGMFVSENDGLSFEGRNGGLITAQFYANFSSSRIDPDFALGGMQDNGTALYSGSEEWSKVLGGDGMSTAFHPFDHKVYFASLQNLEIRRSNNAGLNFFRIGPYPSSSEVRSFNAPYVMSPAHPDFLYAATDRMYRSIDGGDNWTIPDNRGIPGGDPIYRLFPSPHNREEVYTVSISLDPNTTCLHKTVDGGSNWELVEGLPDRICTDMAFDSFDPLVRWVVFSGYDTDHVYHSADGGLNWESRNGNLPDIPVNAILVHPQDQEQLFLGTDLGVFYSFDGGNAWSFISENTGDAMMVSDMNFITAKNKLRIATHGRGAFEVSVPEPLSTKVDDVHGTMPIRIWPNPVGRLLNIEISKIENIEIHSVRAFAIDGKTFELSYSKIENGLRCLVAGLPSGMYVLRIVTEGNGMLSQRFIKK